MTDVRTFAKVGTGKNTGARRSRRLPIAGAGRPLPCGLVALSSAKTRIFSYSGVPIRTLSAPLRCLLRFRRHLASVGFVCLIVGCGGGGGGGVEFGGSTHVLPPNDGVTGPATNCGAASLAPYQHAIFVSTEGTDSANCGATAATACKTIQQGIDLCTATGCAVLVRHGLYPTTATIKLRNAVSVLGSCRFNNEADHKYRTTIQASPAPGSPAIVAEGINSATMVYGVVVVGKDETTSGTASIAMAASSSKGLTLSGTVLAAGKGGDGAHGGETNGAKGGDGFAPTCPTCRGAEGNACPSNPPPSGTGNGGAGAAHNVVDSYGCTGSCYCESVSGADRFGLTGQDSALAKGGGGSGPGAIGCSCWERESQAPGVGTGEAGLWDPGVGPPGQPGGPGQCDAQKLTPNGLIWGKANGTGITWLPSSGDAGGAGSSGAGGGGGGSGGYATWDGQDFNGLSGGGGGGGGCGGPGGGGGQQGGASIALLLSDSALIGVTAQNAIVPGVGGTGGAGGAGGVGGPGGGGGQGYIGPKSGFDVAGTCHANIAPASGGIGGAGGQGGAGGGGAGGNGGPSIGIALRGNSPSPGNEGNVYLGAPGDGGPNGMEGLGPNCVGPPGVWGARGGVARVVNLDHPPTAVAQSETGQQDDK